MNQINPNEGIIIDGPDNDGDGKPDFSLTVAIKNPWVLGAIGLGVAIVAAIIEYDLWPW